MASVVRVENGGQPTIHLCGDLDVSTAGTARVELLSAWQQHPDSPIDLGDLASVDSSGIALLCELAMRAAGSAKRLRLRAVDSGLYRLLTGAGLDHFYTIEPPMPESNAPGTSAPLEGCLLKFPGLPESVPLIRARVQEVARAVGFAEPAVRDVLIAVSEAATNALKYGSPRGAADTILVAWRVAPDRLILQVRDCGCGFDPLAVPLPVPEQLQEGGMGVYFIRALMDEVSFEHDGTGMTVQMIKYRRQDGIAPARPDDVARG
jgi:serine/threonine-protein kinase RsbW